MERMIHTPIAQSRRPPLLLLLLSLCVCVGVCVKGQQQQQQEEVVVFPEASEDNMYTFNTDGTYSFSYDTGSGRHQSFRSERRESDGRVSGRYGYLDPDGALRVTRYQADSQGYRATMEVYQRVYVAPNDPLLVGPLPQQQQQQQIQQQQQQIQQQRQQLQQLQQQSEEVTVGPLPLDGPVPFVPPEGPVLLIGPLPRPIQPLMPMFPDLSGEDEVDEVEEEDDEDDKPRSVPPPPLPQQLVRIIPLNRVSSLHGSNLGSPEVSLGTNDNTQSHTTTTTTTTTKSSLTPEEDITRLQDNQQASTTVLMQNTRQSNGGQLSRVSPELQPSNAMMDNTLLSVLLAAQGGRRPSVEPREKRKPTSELTQGNRHHNNDVSQSSRRDSHVTHQSNTQQQQQHRDVTQGNQPPESRVQQNSQPYSETKERGPMRSGARREDRDSSDETTRQNKRQLSIEEHHSTPLDRETDNKSKKSMEDINDTVDQENIRPLTVTLNPPAPALFTSVRRHPLRRLINPAFRTKVSTRDHSTVAYHPPSSTNTNTNTNAAASNPITGINIHNKPGCWKRVWDTVRNASPPSPPPPPTTTTTTTIATTTTMIEAPPTPSVDLPPLLESLHYPRRRRNKKEGRKGETKESDQVERLSMLLPLTYLPVRREA